LVFLVGCEEGIFPSRQAMDEEGMDDEGIEEERRLCYVGLTRAKRKLFVTNAQVRRIYGQVQVASASRFLHEIPAEFVDAEIQGGSGASQCGVRAAWESERSAGCPSWKAKPAKQVAGGSRRYDYDEPSYKVQSVEAGEGESIRVGQKVKHASYGTGT